MHIALVANPFIPVPPTKYGGTERIIGYLAKGLLEAGHKVTVFASGDSTTEANLIPVCDRHIFFGKNKQEQKKVERQVKEIQRYTMQLLKAHADRFDIVHSHGFDLKDFTEAPSIVTLHSMFKMETIQYYQERQHLNYVSISNNQRLPNQNLNYIDTIYNGLDPEEFLFSKTPKDYVCFIGRLDRDKNPHQAIQLAIQAGIPIKVAGKIDFKGNDYVKEEVAPLLEHPLVEFLGELAMTEKVQLMSQARCNLHPTGFREPFGLTVLEAAYCGTPTIAINRGAMSELIEDGRTGFLVEDFIEAYQHLEAAFKLDRHYVATRARTLFNYRRMTDQYIDAYKKVIKKAEVEDVAQVIEEFSNFKEFARPAWPKYLMN